MIRLFFSSIRRQIAWLVCSLIPGLHRGAPLGIRRLVFLLLVFPLMILLQIIHWLFFLIDEILFWRYRRVEVASPVFVTGVPRSGTTFLHRTLASGEEKFTTFSTWEAIFAPSVTQRKLVRLLAGLDRLIGRPLHRLLRWITRLFAGGMDDIHEVDLSAPEEDYLCLLPAASCFIMFLAFPFSGWLRGLAAFDSVDPGARKRLLRFYRRCLQKHLYCAGAGRRLLSKNAAFGTWSGALREEFPDARLILCIREPGPALSSQLSSLEAARKLFGTDPEGLIISREFFDIYRHNYQFLSEFSEGEGGGHSAIVDMGDLAMDPAAVISSVVERLDLPCSQRMKEVLDGLKPNHRSKHKHNLDSFNVSEDDVDQGIGPFYKMLMKNRNRTILDPCE